VKAIAADRPTAPSAKRDIRKRLFLGTHGGVGVPRLPELTSPSHVAGCGPPASATPQRYSSEPECCAGGITEDFSSDFRQTALMQYLLARIIN